MNKVILITLMMFTLNGCSTYSSSSGYSSTGYGNIRQGTSYYSPYDRAYYSTNSPYVSQRAYAFPYSNNGRYSRHGFNRHVYRSPRYYTTTRSGYRNRPYRNQNRHYRNHSKHRSYNNHRSHRNYKNKRHHKRMNRDRRNLKKQFSNSSLRRRFK